MSNNSKLSDEKIKNFYNEIEHIWALDDLWHLYSKYKIESCLSKVKFPKDSYILNAGSGGNNYNLDYKQHHVDIADRKISHLELYTVASIENLPFNTSSFDGIICVGSVINYCDAMQAISELHRVLKKNGLLILEFENSWGYEYKKRPIYKSAADITEVIFQNQKHVQWLYSHTYIKKIIKKIGFKINRNYSFHILSSYMLSQGYDERMASQYCKFDNILQWVPCINKHANNMILICKRL